MRNKLIAIALPLVGAASPALALPPIPPYTISGGVDLSTNLGHPLKTDAQGQLYVVGGGVGGSVYGTGTLGVVPSQAPVLVGGVNAGGAGGLTQLYTDANGRVVLAGETNGAALSGLGQRMMGSDGTFARDILTDTGGNVYVRGSASSGSTSQTNNLVPIAGYDGTNNRYMLTDTSGRQIVTGQSASGGIIGNPIAVGLSYDNSTVQYFQAVRGIASDNFQGTQTLGTGASIYNGGGWDRVRTANGAANTTGTGLTGAGQLGFDGANWQKEIVDAKGAQFVNVEGQKATYISSGTVAVTSAGTAFFELKGSGTKTIRLLSVRISMTATSGGSQGVFYITRQSTAATGTPTAATILPADSTNAAATAVANTYTSSTSGTLVGIVDEATVTEGAATTPATIYNWSPAERGQSITLRGTSQFIELSGTYPSLPGLAVNYGVTWTEE